MGFVLQLEKALGFMLLAGQTLLTEECIVLFRF